ncbi:hypothetical protein PENSPDRAFT_651831 [Peniophora sp. CONT]|nr:hypothetical protein PENSPDRAFT_651831 [Peniophora sp. CONT]
MRPTSPSANASPPTPTSPVSPTPSSSSSATITPSGSTHALASLLSAATHVVGAHSQSNLDVPSASAPGSSPPGTATPLSHSRSHSLLHRSRSTNQLLALPDSDHHHRRFSLHRKTSRSHSRARSHSRHDAAQIAQAEFIASCEARVRERYPDASEEEIRRRVDAEVEGGMDEAEEYAREFADGDLEEREREEKWAAVRAF